jgi:hypothetical protein
LPSYLQTLRDGCAAKGWAPSSADQLLAYGVAALDDPASEYSLSVLADTHLFLYRIDYVFWLGAEVLIEYGMLRYKPGPVTPAFNAIDQIARQAGVKHIAIGTSAAVRDDAYCRLLSRHGYQQGSVQFIKVLNE